MLDEQEMQLVLEQFAHDVHENKCVWGLQHPSGGWAKCASNQYEDVFVLLFWTKEVEAQAHCVEDWSDYAAVQITASDLIGTWLKEMHKSGDLLVGVNWDAALEGAELEPEAVASKLILGQV